jgi:hypothetical protein
VERVPVFDVSVAVTPALVTLTQPLRFDCPPIAEGAVDVSGLIEEAAPGGSASAGEMVGE